MPKRRWTFLMRAQDHMFLKRTRTLIQIWLTESGVVLFCILFVGSSIASPGTFISAYFLPCFLFAILSTALVMSTYHRPQLEIKRMPYHSPCAGEHLVYRIKVKNTGTKAVKHIALIEGLLPYGLYSEPFHPEYQNTIDFLFPGEEKTVQLVMECKFRGIYELPMFYAGSGYPHNLIRWPIKVGAKHRLVVYPQFESQTNVQLNFRRVYQPGGIAVSSNVGNTNEFLNTREFRQGDRLRDIHWPSYARKGELIVKDYVDEYFVRIGIILDTQLDHNDSQEIFEKRISIAAGIADAVTKKEYIIDLLTTGEHLHHFQAGRALGYIDNLLEILAAIDETDHLDFLKLQVKLKPYLRALSSVIIILGGFDERRSQFCKFLQSTGVQAKILVVSDQDFKMDHPQPVTLITSKDTPLIQ
ncbi:MAG: DUF58 domain-containing protein [Candidatus Omnitrophica bacterium]|nr:DUF58 domain-containing protein [Candidatus Omnitrophota bacterium]